MAASSSAGASGRAARSPATVGRYAAFAIIYYATGEGWLDAARRMDRCAAADLLREVCTERFGSVEHAVVPELALRYDGGSCFRATHSQAEIKLSSIARRLRTSVIALCLARPCDSWPRRA